MEREITCTFTGHRPDKLPWGLDESDLRCQRLKERLYRALEAAYEEGARHFICGMALGCDHYFAEAVLRLREKHEEVTLEAARPCESQADSWTLAQRTRYFALLDQCDFETLVQHNYTKLCMIRRNHYMVDHARWLIAVYDGVPSGGTAQTLAYALRQGLKTNILELKED